MFLALQRSTCAAIHDFIVARAMFLEAVVLLLFISEISPSDTRGKLGLVYCHCSSILILLNKMRIFEGGNTSVLCSGISVVWMFTSVFAVVAKRYKTMLWRAEVHLNMSTYPQRNSSG